MSQSEPKKGYPVLAHVLPDPQSCTDAPSKTFCGIEPLVASRIALGISAALHAIAIAAMLEPLLIAFNSVCILLDVICIVFPKAALLIIQVFWKCLTGVLGLVAMVYFIAMASAGSPDFTLTFSILASVFAAVLVAWQLLTAYILKEALLCKLIIEINCLFNNP